MLSRFYRLLYWCTRQSMQLPDMFCMQQTFLSTFGGDRYEIIPVNICFVAFAYRPRTSDRAVTLKLYMTYLFQGYGGIVPEYPGAPEVGFKKENS